MVVLLGACGAPSDHALMLRFREHQQDFEILRQMSDTDRINGGLAPNAGPWYRLSQPRREEYRRLFHDLGLERGLERDGTGAVRFEAACVGLVTSGYCKGLVYSAATLTPTFDDLDDAKTDPRLLAAEVGYRTIEDHWYVFLQR